MLPLGRLDANGIKLLNLYPAPTGPGLFNNYTSEGVFSTTLNHVDARVDHNFSTKDQMFGRVSVTPASYFGPELFPAPTAASTRVPIRKPTSTAA
jgi:hypothetical protein